MARWHRMEKGGEVVWTETPEAYGEWKETATGNRPPGDHEDKVDGIWKVDKAAREKKARRDRRKGISDEVFDEIVTAVIERLKAEGLIGGKA